MAKKLKQNDIKQAVDRLKHQFKDKDKKEQTLEEFRIDFVKTYCPKKGKNGTNR
jgi:hypothetical protein